MATEPPNLDDDLDVSDAQIREWLIRLRGEAGPCFAAIA